jgi:hypothetical protein
MRAIKGACLTWRGLWLAEVVPMSFALLSPMMVSSGWRAFASRSGDTGEDRLRVLRAERAWSQQELGGVLADARGRRDGAQPAGGTPALHTGYGFFLKSTHRP